MTEILIAKRNAEKEIQNILEYIEKENPDLFIFRIDIDRIDLCEGKGIIIKTSLDIRVK